MADEDADEGLDNQGGGDDGKPGEVSQPGQPSEGTPDWKSLVPEYGREYAEVANAADFETFFKDYDNLRSFRGQAIRIPGEDASAEERKEVYDKIRERMPELLAQQAPGEAAAYDVNVEGFTPDEERLTSIKAHALAAGLSVGQYEKFIGAMAGDEVAAATAAIEARVASDADLRAEWGGAYDQKIAGVHNFLERMGAPQSFMEAESQGLMDANDYKWLDDLNQRIGGEGSPGAGLGGDPRKLTPSEAATKIAEIRNNPEHPFNQGVSHPGNQKAIQDVLELQRMLPDGKKQVGQGFSSGAEIVQ